MKKKIMKAGIFAAFLMLISSTAITQTAEELLPQAIQLEEVKGELEKAIELYNKILKEFPENKVIAAKSQLHLGFCYEKLGLKKAEEAYQDVLSKYPDQLDIVEIAREKLAIYANKPLSNPGNEGEFRIRKVWADPPETYGGGISPNGRYLTFINWDSAEMALHDLETGKTRDITNVGTWREEGYQFPDASVWSPDSRQIASWWIIGKNENRHSELRIIDIADGKSRVLSQNNFDNTPYPFSWSKDGKTIWAVKMIPDEYIEGGTTDRSNWGYDIVTISVANGAVNKVISKGKGVKSSGRNDISPDGKYFIYDSSQDSDRDIFDIHLVSADNKKDVLIASHPAHDWAPQWSKDGKQILFLSKRNGSNSLWSVKVEKGVQVGEPFLIKESLPNQVQSLGISDAGDYYFSTSNMFSDLYIAEMDMETGKLINQPEKLKVELEAYKFKPLWLPNGKSITYFMPGSDWRPGINSPKIVVHNVENGKTFSIMPDDYFPHDAAQFSYPTIADEGRSIVGLRGEPNKPDSFIKIDLINGETKVIKMGNAQTMEKDRIGAFPKLSENGQILYYVSGDKKEIASYDLMTKKETVIFRSEKQMDYIAFSPDLTEAVFNYFEQNRNQLWIISLKGGNPKLLGSLNKSEMKDDQVLRQLVWSPDGKYVFCQSTPSHFLWKIARNGEGGFMKCELNMNNRDYFQVNPDGSKVVFAEMKGKYAEVWVMENYLK